MKLKKHSKILIGIVVAVLLLTGITAGYLQSYYHTDTQAVSAYQLQQSFDSDIQTKTLSDGSIVCIPKNPKAGFIFYPGGKVETSAYEPIFYVCLYPCRFIWQYLIKMRQTEYRNSIRRLTAGILVDIRWAVQWRHLMYQSMQIHLTD